MIATLPKLAVTDTMMQSGQGAAVTPVRLQLSRRKGFDLQALSLATNGLPAVKVDRSTPHGNPWTVAEAGSAEAAGRLFEKREHAFREMCPDRYAREMARLRARNLACWCQLPNPGEPDHCHVVVLIKNANRPVCEAIPATPPLTRTHALSEGAGR